jgi:hypothetical protein
MMTARQRRWLAGLLGTGLVALLLVLAAFDNLFNPEPRERTTVRAVELYEPPPPPPPPPAARRSSARRGGSTGTLLTLERSRAPVPLDVMKLDVELMAVELGALSLGGLGRGFGRGVGDGTGDGSGGFGLATLSELDQQPVVLSAPVFPYPDEATARGIREFDLRFDIVIDEEGRTYPLAIVQNPFPASSGVFLKWASRVRFSPPTRLGIPVSAEYTWPVKVLLPGQ